MSPLNCLPREIWLHINSFVPVTDTFRLMLTCKGTKQLAEVSLHDRVNELIQFWITTHSNPKDSVLGNYLLIKWIRIRYSLNEKITFNKMDAILKCDRLAWSVITGMYPHLKSMRGKHPSGREWPRLLKERDPIDLKRPEEQHPFFVLNELARVDLAVPFSDPFIPPAVSGNDNLLVFTKGPKPDDLVINYLNTDNQFQMMKMVQQVEGYYSFHHLVQRAFTGMLPYAKEGERISFHNVKMKVAKRRSEDRFAGPHKRSRANPKH